MLTVPRRIAVVGTTGSGKTTLAHLLSLRLGIDHIELDAIHWGPEWQPLALEEFRIRTSQALAGDAWVVDGNYSKVRDIVWKRADTVVWLDYRLSRVLYQLFKRTLHRIITREELWNDNRENFRAQFFSQDSLFIWALKSYPKQRKNYPILFDKPEFGHLRIVKLSSPKAVKEWIDKVPN